MDFRIVIPAYRESQRLPSFLRQLVSTLADAEFDSAILVVDDGSGPVEQSILTDLVASFTSSKPQVLSPLLQQVNQGKGAAVRAGWTESQPEAKWLVFLDADGAISAAEVRRVLSLVTHNDEWDAVFGSRIKMLGHDVERSVLRHLTGRVFATLTSLLVVENVYDSQCGFKVIRSDVYRKIAPKLKENGFCFDVELIAALNHAGARLREIPIDWRDVAGSKVSFFRDVWRMFVGLLKIRERKMQWN